MKIALAGNPNSGKTTMYNALTGQNETVGNWAGVTVDKKEHPVKKAYWEGKDEPVAVDLPGAYSMSPFTGEESITSAYVREENPDVLVNIVDATNLSRSLFFTTQLLELGIPTVVALNKSDINEKKKTEIDETLLSTWLQCPVISTVSTSADGLTAVVAAAMATVGKRQTAPYTQGKVDETDRKAVEAADRKRYAFVNKIVKDVEKRKTGTKDKTVGDRIDCILTNKWLGIPIFAAVMFLVFQISQVWLGTWIADGVDVGGIFIPGLVPLLETFQEWVAGLFEGATPLLTALLIDGMLGGVIAVVGFLPLVMVMYFLIALLEDCGYMSRVAVVLDPMFKRVGLSGKSVIPFVMGIGCAVPGVMAARTVRDERERRATVMLTPFMPCGAKIPVISLFAGAFFDNAGWVSTLMYFTGILLIFLCALLINRLTAYTAKISYFIIELPDYKVPSFPNAFKSMCGRGKDYIVKAATVILLCNTAVQLMQSFTWSFEVAAEADRSILASVAEPFAYLLLPIVGVVSWQLAAAAITGFIAKENVVGTLAVCFVGLDNLINTEDLSMIQGSGGEVAGILAITKVAALAYLMFNLFSPPCFAAIGAMNAEMKSGKWLFAAVGLQLGVGFTVGYLVYTLGTLLTNPATLPVGGVVIGGVAVLVMAAVVTALCLRAGKTAKTSPKTEVTV